MSDVAALTQDCDVNSQHLLISYQWGAKSTVFKIKERLKATGYRVCTDVENTGMQLVCVQGVFVKKKQKLSICVQSVLELPDTDSNTEYYSRVII